MRDEIEKRIRKKRGGWQQIIIENTTCAAPHRRGGCGALNVVAEAGVISSDDSSHIAQRVWSGITRYAGTSNIFLIIYKNRERLNRSQPNLIITEKYIGNDKTHPWTQSLENLILEAI